MASKRALRRKAPPPDGRSKVKCELTVYHGPIRNTVIIDVPDGLIRARTLTRMAKFTSTKLAEEFGKTYGRVIDEAKAKGRL